MKMTAFTDSEYTYLHELDLEVIKERVEGVCSAFEWVADGTCINVVNEFSGNVAHQLDVGDSDDAQFIAHARQDVPALITEVERLRKENELFENVVELSEKRRQASEEENARLREKLNNKSETLQRFERQLRLFISDNSTLRLALQQIQNSDAWFIDSDINEEDAYLRCVEIADKALGGEPDE